MNFERLHLLGYMYWLSIITTTGNDENPSSEHESFKLAMNSMKTAQQPLKLNIQIHNDPKFRLQLKKKLNGMSDLKRNCNFYRRLINRIA